eukprot:TRINITY_DN502_c0_g1_i1.p1 TRINITY_DN502_c0_g1~~TRINITY_DN502_c0_g1_i1.p1  ORF type:complete len:1115 (-),score=261.55 TRINITY_DN502_c0_g1_i1:90-3434(-)
MKIFFRTEMDPTVDVTQNTNVVKEDIYYAGNIVSRKQLEVTAITIYSSEVLHYLGARIAVNSNYICYVVKGNMIRVINIYSAQRCLLRGHHQPVTDLQFFSKDDDILGSVGEDGQIYIWKIIEDSDEEKITYEKALHIKPEGAGVYHERIVWHPRTKGVFATASTNGLVYVWQVAHLKSESGEQTGGKPLEVGCKINDIAFSSDGKYLAAAGEDGYVRVWDWDVPAANPILLWAPHPISGSQKNEPVYAVRFFARQQKKRTNNKEPEGKKDVVESEGFSDWILTGGKNNSVLRLWEWDGQNSAIPKAKQCVRFATENDGTADDKFFNHIALDPTNTFLCVANSKQPVCYIVHLAHTKDSCEFDYLAEFPVHYGPILSFNIINDPKPDAVGPVNTPENIAEMQLYCVQPKGIQMYHITPKECRDAQQFLNASAKTAEKESPETKVVSGSSVDQQENENEKEKVATAPTVPAQEAEANPPTEKATAKNTPKKKRKEKKPLSAKKTTTVVVIPPKGTEIGTTNGGSSSPANDAKRSGRKKDNSTPNGTKRKQGKATSDEVPIYFDEVALHALPSNIRYKVTHRTYLQHLTDKAGGHATVTVQNSGAANRNAKISGNTSPAPDGSAGSAATRSKRKKLCIMIIGDDTEIVKTIKTDILNYIAKFTSRATQNSNSAEITTTPAPASPTDGSRQKRGKKAKLATPPGLGVDSDALSPRSSGGDSAGGSEAATEDNSTVVLPTDSVSGVKELYEEMRATRTQIKAVEAKLERSLQSRMDRIVQQMDRHFAKREKEARERDRIYGERQQRLINTLSAVIKNSQETAMERQGETLSRALISMEERLAATLSTDIRSAVISNEIGGTPADASNLAPVLRKAIQQSVRENFRSTLAPAFERSCQRMFEQINETLKAGIQYSGNSAGGGGADINNNAAVFVQQMRSAVETLVEISVGLNQNIGMKLSSDGAEELRNVKVKKKKVNYDDLLHRKKYAEAIRSVVREGNLTLLVKVISAIPARQFFAKNTLEPKVAGALIQQLTADLANDTEKKVPWLEETLVTVDAEDLQGSPALCNLFSDFVSDLLRSAQELGTSSRDVALKRSLKRLMHLANSVLQSFQSRNSFG